MKNKTELVQSWLRKAASNETALAASLEAQSYDTACFHAQQAVEIYLKAFLIYRDVDYPFTHNLVKLVDQCAEIPPLFASLTETVAPLTPYAVELRYDHEFWPEKQTAQQAQQAAASVALFVRNLLNV